MHVAAYIEWLGLPNPQGPTLSKPSVKQHLAGIRMLFDWLGGRARSQWKEEWLSVVEREPPSD